MYVCICICITYIIYIYIYRDNHDISTIHLPQTIQFTLTKPTWRSFGVQHHRFGPHMVNTPWLLLKPSDTDGFILQSLVDFSLLMVKHLKPRIFFPHFDAWPFTPFQLLTSPQVFQWPAKHPPKCPLWPCSPRYAEAVPRLWSCQAANRLGSPLTQWRNYDVYIYIHTYILAFPKIAFRCLISSLTRVQGRDSYSSLLLIRFITNLYLGGNHPVWSLYWDTHLSMGNCPWPNGDYTMMIDIGKHKSKYAYIDIHTL